MWETDDEGARRRQRYALRMALRGGVSVIAFGIVLGRGPGAYAQQVISASSASTVNSDGTGILVNPDVDLTGSPGISNATGTGTIYSQGTIESGSFGLVNSSTIGTLTNAAGGTIAGPSDGIYNSAGSIGTLSNSGLLYGNGANARGVQNQGGTIGLLTNSGAITGSSGIAAQTGIGTIINQNGGTISSTGADYGIYVNAPIALLDNQDGGTIASGSGTGVLVQAHSLATLTNEGLLTGAEGAGNLNGTITALDNTGTISGTLEGMYNDAQIGTLSNGGTVSGATYGIQNAMTAAIGTLTNSGTITASGGGGNRLDALSNAGSITTLSNVQDATIIGENTGIANNGTIATLTNSGLISGTSYEGIIADGTIGALDNTSTGTISGADQGIGDGYIGTLTNAGIITGGYQGIYEIGTIGTLNNSGDIYSSSYYSGINLESGTIGVLTNTGTVSGAFQGIGVAGSIGMLTNQGTITGTAAGLVNESGDIAAFYNDSAGTLAGAISGTIGVFNEAYHYGNNLDVSSIATLTNGLPGGAVTKDTIFGTITGIENESTIGALSNNGTITGGTYGIVNSYAPYQNESAYVQSTDAAQTHASITTLTNTGSITGGLTAVYNDGGWIGTLSNSGSIAGATIAGVDNIGTIGTVANTIGGTIYGGRYGVFNGSSAPTANGSGSQVVLNAPDVLTNSGKVITSSAGTQLAPGGSISVLANSGSISGGSTGVYNDGGYIGTLSNGGTITGTAKIGVANIAGAMIGTLTNLAGGTISGAAGATAIFNSSAIAALNNSGVISAGLGIANHSSSVSSIASIGVLTNAGTIYAPGTGILNYNGTIGTLSNSGAILNARTGIADFGGGTILTLANNGTVTGTGVAIRDQGAIGTISNSSIVSAGSSGVLIANVALASLANSGTISGAVGVYNEDGTIGTVSQSGGGTIYGGAYGVYNNSGAAIGQLSNGLAMPVTADTIFGSITGVSNDGGYIGNLTNNGTIAGGTYGIANSLYEYSFQEEGELIAPTANQSQGSITTLANSGSIYGGAYGIYNDGGYIGTLGNTGTIAGGATAIVNDNGATIATLTNSGTIFGTIGGINNSDTTAAIGTIINQSTGTIYGGAVALSAGDGTGINNAGLITSGDILLQPALKLGSADIVTNSGTILGGGLLYDGADSTVTNSGTIAAPGQNAVNFYDDGTNYLTLTTGTDIVGTIYGNGSPGQITLDGTGNLTAPIADFGGGSALNVDSNGDWTASGTWAIAAVTNDGSFGPGETADGGVGSTLYLTGNFTQNADGTLLVAVAPEEAAFTTSDFVITGSASLNGAVDVTFAPGTYEAGSHSFLSATDVTGTFSSEIYNGTPSGLTASVTYPDETDPLLVLSGAGTGIVNAGTTTTTTIATPTPPVITPPVITPPAASPPTFVVRPPDTGIFADELQAAASRAQSANTGLLNQAAEGAAASAVCAAEAGVTPAQTTPDKITGVEKLTNAVADAFCGAGGWIQASGTAMNVEGEGATPGYNADTAGFLAGIDAPVNAAGTRLGLAVGYDETFLADSAGGKGQVDTVRAGIFGSQAAGPFTLAADFLYGHTSTNSQRVTGIGDAKSSADGNIYSGALQADTLVPLGTLNFVPQAGLRIAGISGGGFAESGVLPAFALTGTGGFYTSVQPFVNLDVSTIFYTESNVAITPDASFGYAYEAGDVGHALAVTAHDGTRFATDYLKLDPSIAELSAGISAGKGAWSFYARYSAALTGNWTSQTGEAGLRIRF